LGPCAQKQMRFILVITDRFSKKIHTLGYKKMPNTREIISFIMGSNDKEWGELKGIVSDQGSQFRSSEWKQFVSQNDIIHR
jgi:transposase InsO family protein